MQSKKLISIVFSFRNEEETLSELINSTLKVLEELPFSFEFIFVNDASTDKSLEILKEYALKDSRIKVINLSRRFGYNEGFIAGISYAKGEAIITMDADLQDPPQVIPKLIDKWQEGADVVHTVREKRVGENFFKLFLTKLAYRIIRVLSEIELLNDAGNFKLISKRVKEELLKLKEKQPYLRGLVCWVGFKQSKVYYKRNKRFAGKGHFPILTSSGPLQEFISGITSFSIFPLVGVFLLGLCFLFIGVVLIFSIYLFNFSIFPLALLILFSGIYLTALGIVATYIGKIWEQVKGRPLYIVESTINLKEEDLQS